MFASSDVDGGRLRRLRERGTKILVDLPWHVAYRRDLRRSKIHAAIIIIIECNLDAEARAINGPANSGVFLVAKRF